MKRVVFIIAFVASTLCQQSAMAQSFDDLLKGLSGLFGSTTTTAPAAEKPVYPKEKELIGTWIYTEPQIVYEGNDALASMAIATIKGQVPALAEKFGVVAGRDYAVVKKSKITAVSGERKANATYTYIPSAGKAIVTGEHNGKKIIVTGYVTMKDGKVTVLFDANELLAIVSQTQKFKENTTLQMMASVIQSYPGIKVGATARKR